MRILVTGFTRNRGGVEGFIINYYRNIKKFAPDFCMDILCYIEHPAYEDEIYQLGGNVYVIEGGRKDKKNKTFDFFEKYSNKYDILWCNKCDLGNIVFLIAAKQNGIKKIILHSHSSSNMHTGLRKYVTALVHQINKLRISKYVTDYWACSDYAAEWMFPKDVINSGIVNFIPNAIDAEKFRFNKKIREEYRKKLEIDGKLVFGCIGQISYVKNPEFTLEVFEEVYKKRNDVCLLMIGTGNLEDKIKKKANAMVCGKAIKFMGVRTDVSQIMQALDCCLLPSRFEGLPIVAIEAQAAGLPVFAASDGITSQTKLTEQFYFLSLSDNAEDWANAILSKKLYRIDTFTQIKESGFEIESASENLYNML